jgi:hypothetical protein
MLLSWLEGLIAQDIGQILWNPKYKVPVNNILCDELCILYDYAANRSNPWCISMRLIVPCDPNSISRVMPANLQVARTLTSWSSGLMLSGGAPRFVHHCNRPNRICSQCILTLWDSWFSFFWLRPSSYGLSKTILATWLLLLTWAYRMLTFHWQTLEW